MTTEKTQAITLEDCLFVIKDEAKGFVEESYLNKLKRVTHFLGLISSLYGITQDVGNHLLEASLWIGLFSSIFGLCIHRLQRIETNGNRLMLINTGNLLFCLFVNFTAFILMCVAAADGMITDGVFLFIYYILIVLITFVQYFTSLFQWCCCPSKLNLDKKESTTAEDVPSPIQKSVSLGTPVAAVPVQGQVMIGVPGNVVVKGQVVEVVQGQVVNAV